ncbi:MAG: tetratricopeptide repeat protein, partial [Luteolibacter sp.]
MEKPISLSLNHALHKLTAVVGVAAALPLMSAKAPAQAPAAVNLSALAKREMIRRQNDVLDADALFVEGRKAYAAGDFQMAVDKFSAALQKVPDAPLFADRRGSYNEHLIDARVALAMIYTKDGQLEEAETLLNEVLKTNPANKDAISQLERLKDPTRTNPALTLKYTEDVQRVNELLVKADGAYMLGKYDEAKRSYEKILGIDKFNVTARRG